MNLYHFVKNLLSHRKENAGSMTMSLKIFIKKWFPNMVGHYKNMRQDFQYKNITLPSASKDMLLNLYVIGARGNCSPFVDYLRRKKILKTIGFEPDPVEQIKLATAGAYDLVLPFALGSRSEHKELKLTKERGCSSLLDPDMIVVKRLCTKPEWFEVENSVIVETQRLDNIVMNHKIKSTPDMVQIDVQGYEMEVLKGFGDLLSEIRILQIETVFYPIYFHQPLFHEIHDFMTQNDFILFSIEKHGVFGNNFVEGNVIYINNNHFNSDAYSGTKELDQFCLNNCQQIFS